MYDLAFREFENKETIKEYHKNHNWNSNDLELCKVDSSNIRLEDLFNNNVLKSASYATISLNDFEKQIEENLKHNDKTLGSNNLFLKEYLSFILFKKNQLQIYF